MGYLIPMTMEENRCTTEEGCADTRRRMYLPGGEFGRGEDMATMEVDTVGTLCRATEAAWGWVTPDMGSGLGWAVFCP